MRYFIVVARGYMIHSRAFHLSISFKCEHYPSIDEIKTRFSDELSKEWDWLIESICIENIMELSEEDYKSYKG